jgi:hypothetical protein
MKPAGDAVESSNQIWYRFDPENLCNRRNLRITLLPVLAPLRPWPETCQL